jgi:hypothetical protein
MTASNIDVSPTLHTDRRRWAVPRTIAVLVTAGIVVTLTYVGVRPPKHAHSARRRTCR